MKRLSRTAARVDALLYLLGVALILLGAFVQQAVLWGIGIVLLVGAFILQIIANRCPHCGAYFRGLFLFAPDAGYCKKCGKKLEFDR